MARRKLTQKQRRTLGARYDQRAGPVETQMSSGAAIALVIARYGKMADLLPEDAQPDEVLRADIRATLQGAQRSEDIVVGDQVYYQTQDHTSNAVVVGRISPRNQLRRGARTGAEQPIASNIDQLVIVWSPVPAMSTQGVEQYWVAACKYQIEPVLVLNKIDLSPLGVEHCSLSQMRLHANLYQQLGLDVLEVSAKTTEGIDQLAATMAGKTSVFMGVSGAGKSSLVNALLGVPAMSVGHLSQDSVSGTHTTTTARLLPLLSGSRPGHLIDAPGIRSFDLSRADEAQVLAAYPDIAPFAHQCKFNDCAHQSEPGCAVRDAVACEQIKDWRFENYTQLRAVLCKKKRG